MYDPKGQEVSTEDLLRERVLKLKEALSAVQTTVDEMRLVMRSTVVLAGSCIILLVALHIMQSVQ